MHGSEFGRDDKRAPLPLARRDARSVIRRGRRGWLRSLGPGLITGASSDDPGSIGTFAQVGAQFGYGLAWVLPLSWPLVAAIQEISARIGRVTGQGIAGNIERHYSRPFLHAVVLLLLVANSINIGADLGAMGAALHLLVGGSAKLYVSGLALSCALLEVFSRYERYVAILKWSTLSLFAYVATALVVGVPWGRVVHDSFVPNLIWQKRYLVALVASLGTTITPYCFFWQSSQEAEDARVDPTAEPLRDAPQQARVEIARMRYDTYLGMGFSNLISLFIVITAAATLNAHGITDIQTSAQAAEALRPIAGTFTFAVFAAGIVGTGMLAVPVLAASSAYALGEALGWATGLGRSPREAKAFYGTIAISTVIGVGITFVDIDPIKALFWAAVLNGVIAVPLMVMIMIMAMEPRVMGAFTLPRTLRAMGWLGTGVMAAAVAAMVLAG